MKDLVGQDGLFLFKTISEAEPVAARKESPFQHPKPVLPTVQKKPRSQQALGSPGNF